MDDSERIIYQNRTLQSLFQLEITVDSRGATGLIPESISHTPATLNSVVQSNR